METKENLTKTHSSYILALDLGPGSTPLTSARPGFFGFWAASDADEFRKENARKESQK
jgi:hypothetical protein